MPPLHLVYMKLKEYVRIYIRSFTKATTIKLVMAVANMYGKLYAKDAYRICMGVPLLGKNITPATECARYLKIFVAKTPIGID